ncbi:tRNA pseudouridine65 synthase [Chishuiella changwenlii]|uniref:tRNA pseudouridine synthase C n=1 Tax=Chishuiella changwenlii TaxID=1434701 RepID=A0A1M7AFD3_9FLAO|nr:pseudouridine synthase [Chishuiella changwenlii]GGE90126.1 tRNA pseudouridine(65) synthase TruC [Chishuiella changwenlii]SHL41347.1 tRNA pseudouridine65 synthase [Chishuiella changwenlii]
MLEILYQDEYLVAINKPSGLLVHKSFYARDAKVYAVQELRNQIGGQHVYPIHRLDRKTSGVLIFALDKEVLKVMNEYFASREVEKKYLAILRGWAPKELTIDYDLTNDDGVKQNAITYFHLLQTAEIDLEYNNHPTSRYCLVEAIPETGRMHQLRKHFRHIFHPILGSRPHGCNKQNKLWLENFGLTGMMLHAHQLIFNHPITKERIVLNATINDEFTKVGEILGLDLEQYKKSLN